MFIASYFLEIGTPPKPYQPVRVYFVADTDEQLILINADRPSVVLELKANLVRRHYWIHNIHGSNATLHPSVLQVQ